MLTESLPADSPRADPTKIGCHVHVVDDDDSFRISLTRVLSAAGLQAVGYRCAGEFLLSDAATRPGCIVLDISMPGPSGVELLDALRSREAAPPIIFVTGCTDVATSVHAMKAGAVDFLTKPVRAEVLLASVNQALRLDDARRQGRREKEELQRRFASLTDRERAVMLGVARGILNKQLAIELDTCERTIKTHRARMLSKLGLNSLADLIRAARLLGLETATGNAPQEQSPHRFPDSPRGRAERPNY